MRANVQIIDGYHEDARVAIDVLKSMTPPETVARKEYVAVVTGQQVCIFSVNIGMKCPSLTDSVFSQMAEKCLFIGAVAVGDISEGVHRLIYQYWEKLRMRADKEAALMYSPSKFQEVINL
jgi:hypothetical protein